MTSEGTERKFPQGSDIFREGEPGGDLYFISDGVVEVYRSVGNQTVSFGTLGKGEVLGIISFLNSGNRAASARAKTDVKALVVSGKNAQALLNQVPQWIRALVHDCIVRINQMDNLYTSTVLTMRRLMHEMWHGTLLAKRMVESLQVLFELASKEVNGKPGLALDDAERLLTRLYAKEQDEVSFLFGLFKDCGLFNAETDAAGTPHLTEDGVKDLVKFAAFVEERDQRKRDGAEVKLLSAEFSLLEELPRLCERLGLKENESVRLSTAQVHEELKRAQAASVESSAFEKAEKFKILAVERGGPGPSRLVFVPCQLGRFLAWCRFIAKADAYRPDGDQAPAMAGVDPKLPVI